MRKSTGILMLSLLALAILGAIAGCGNSEPSDDEAQVEPAGADENINLQVAATSTGSPSESAEDTVAASGTSTDASIPAPDVPEDASVLQDVYPALTDGALRHARLVDLPADVLLQAEGVKVTKANLETELKEAPAQMRDKPFFLFEQVGTRDLLTALARQRVEEADALKEEELFQRYFDELTSTVSVSDDEVQAFYDENREMIGGAEIEQMRDRIRQHLLQQKQQQTVEKHVAELGKETTVGVSADWIAEQAPKVLDNPVDNARGNGKPTFVNFGAEGCKPCDMMSPIREKLAEQLKEHADVVFVNVREQQMLSSRYGVRGIPQLVFFDENGKEVHTHTGFMPEEQIREWLKKSGVTDA